MTSLRALACAIIVATAALISSTTVHAQGTPLFAVLNGGNECNGGSPPLCRNGDLDAHGSATIIFPTTTSLCFAILVDNLAGATAAHIHRGVTGVNGGIVVNLAPPSAPGGGNTGRLVRLRQRDFVPFSSISSGPRQPSSMSTCTTLPSRPAPSGASCSERTSRCHDDHPLDRAGDRRRI